MHIAKECCNCIRRISSPSTHTTWNTQLLLFPWVGTYFSNVTSLYICVRALMHTLLGHSCLYFVLLLFIFSAVIYFCANCTSPSTSSFEYSSGFDGWYWLVYDTNPFMGTDFDNEYVTEPVDLHFPRIVIVCWGGSAAAEVVYSAAPLIGRW